MCQLEPMPVPWAYVPRVWASAPHLFVATSAALAPARAADCCEQWHSSPRKADSVVAPRALFDNNLHIRMDSFPSYLLFLIFKNLFLQAPPGSPPGRSQGSPLLYPLLPLS